MRIMQGIMTGHGFFFHEIPEKKKLKVLSFNHQVVAFKNA